MFNSCLQSVNSRDQGRARQRQDPIKQVTCFQLSSISSFHQAERMSMCRSWRSMKRKRKVWYGMVTIVGKKACPSYTHQNYGQAVHQTKKEPQVVGGTALVE